MNQYKKARERDKGRLMGASIEDQLYSTIRCADVDNKIQHIMEKKLRPIRYGMLFHEWTVECGVPKAICENKDGEIELIDTWNVVFQDR